MNEPSEHQAERPERRISLEEVAALYCALGRLGILVWVDGGWGVDALLGEQTRTHRDLDIAIQEQDLPRLREFLEARGYGEVRRHDSKPWNFVLGDRHGREIDIHVIVLDGAGNGILGPVEKGQMYPAAALKGVGTLGATRVRCISPEWMVKFHSGYELTEKDYEDVSALCRKFGLALPAEYGRFRR
jgi:lincosamide nucleotidyltransferase A/C/D/E